MPLSSKEKAVSKAEGYMLNSDFELGLLQKGATDVYIIEVILRGVDE